jgi:hypothetical protein
MVLARENHDGDCGDASVSLLRGKELPAVDVWHAEIEQYRVRRGMRLEVRQGVGAVADAD